MPCIGSLHAPQNLDSQRVFPERFLGAPKLLLPKEIFLQLEDREATLRVMRKSRREAEVALAPHQNQDRV